MFSGGIRITTNKPNQNIIDSIREQEATLHPTFKLDDPNTGFKLKEMVLDLESESNIIVNGGTPVFVKDGYSSTNIESVLVESVGTEVIVSYVY